MFGGDKKFVEHTDESIVTASTEDKALNSLIEKKNQELATEYDTKLTHGLLSNALLIPPVAEWGNIFTDITGDKLPENDKELALIYLMWVCELSPNQLESVVQFALTQFEDISQEVEQEKDMFPDKVAKEQ